MKFHISVPLLAFFKKSPLLLTMREVLRKDKFAMFSLAIILLITFFAIFADYIAPFPYYYQDLSHSLTPPGVSLQYLLGTDHLGRDIFSRIIYGTRIILYEIIFATFISVSVGILLGVVSGYLGGAFDYLFSRFIDILLSFPSLLLAIAFIGLLGTGLNNAIVAVAISQIGVVARLARGQIVQAKKSTYVEVEKMMGASGLRIMFLHIMPDIAGPLLVQITFNMADALLSISGLSFLGLGAQPPTPDWGTMVYEGRLYLSSMPHASLIPGLCLLIVALSLNVMGETLRDCLDPKVRALLIK